MEDLDAFLNPVKYAPIAESEPLFCLQTALVVLVAAYCGFRPAIK